MWRTAHLILAFTLFSTVASAQQPCTQDARQVVNELYRHMLERSADPGSATFVNRLQNGSATVRDIVREIANSAEHQQRFVTTSEGRVGYERSVASLYRHILGRQPDDEGSRHWAEVAETRGIGAVVDELIRSGEYEQRFGDFGVPGSGGVRYCGPNAQPTAQTGPMRFRNMDRNNDGIIAQNEWQGTIQAFRANDWNSDGVLSGDEVRIGAARRETAGPIRRDGNPWNQPRFGYIDRNDDGRITRNEWPYGNQLLRRVDQNGDGDVSRSEFLGTDRDESFVQLDDNGNGRVDRAEWQGSTAVWEWLDANNDSVLNRAEVIEAYGSRADNFGDADVNNDGVISRNEWQGPNRTFTDQDVNNDGVLTRREFRYGDTGETGVAGYAISVDPTQPWTDTGLTVRAGDTINLDAQGSIQLSTDGNDTAGPAGANRRAANAPLRQQAAGALIARIGNSIPIHVGDRRSFRAPASGRLFLGVNDDFLRDNGGEFRVTVNVREF
jgi:hypothetical protein